MISSLLTLMAVGAAVELATAMLELLVAYVIVRALFPREPRRRPQRPRNAQEPRRRC
jgi:hypothetical protein